MLLEHNIIKHKEMPLFERAKFKTPFHYPGEFDNLACFFYIVEGEYEVVEMNGGFRIGSKEALVKKCGNYVSRYLQTDEHESCEAIAIYLWPELLQEMYRYKVPTFLKEGVQTAPPPKMITSELIDKYISNLQVYFENPSLIDEELALLKLRELVMILLKSAHYASVQQFLIDIFSPRNLEFTAIVENNIFSNISIEELAFICNQSLSTFKREFKKVYKETPARYIKNRRLEHAANLLVKSEDTISGIAYDSGFQDASTFSYVFQQKYGVSPSQYRLDKMRKRLS